MTAEAPYSITVTFYAATLSQDVNYPTPGEDHILPAGTTGIARRTGRGRFIFYPDDVPEGWPYGERSSGYVGAQGLSLDESNCTQHIYDIRHDLEQS